MQGFCRLFSKRCFSSSSFQPQDFNKVKGRKSGVFGKALIVTMGAGYAVYTFKNFQDALEKSSVYDVSPYKLVLYRTLPLGCVTALAGKVASLEVPPWLRGPFYGLYSWIYSCDKSECAPLESYPTFNDFFTRSLNPGKRPISNDILVSPADGKVLACGKLNDIDDSLYPEQIKGVKYPLKKFLGTQLEALQDGGRRNSKKCLYYCSIYLAPGSYHRFHSPINGFNVKSVERIPGEVLPVAPWVMRLVPGLVCLNERAVISGSWKYGAFHMVPVGATNVRSIALKWPSYETKVFDKLSKGQEVGQFEMGSLVVLVFEGPENFSWSAQPNSSIKYGESLGTVPFNSNFSWWSFNQTK